MSRLPACRASGALPGVLLAALLLLAPGCQMLTAVLEDMQKPSVSLASVGLSQLDLASVTLDVAIDVSNPYPVALPLLELDYALASGGAAFLEGRSSALGTVEAGSTRRLNIPATIRFGDLLAAVSGIAPGVVVPYSLDLTVAVDAPALGRIELPIRKDGELPVPAIPDVSLEGLEWDKLGFDEARATLRVRVENTNAFPFDLVELAYGLSLAGRSIADVHVAEAGNIASGGSRTLEVPISFSPQALGLALFSALSDDRADYSLSGRMAIDTPFGPIDMPFSRSGETSLGK